MKTVRVRAFYTTFPHTGAHSGIRQLVRHVDPAIISMSLRAVSDSDQDWPVPGAALNTRIRNVGVRAGMAWYKLSDLAAEIRALPASLSNAVDVVHFLDAEHTGQFLPGWIRKSGISRVKTIGTFHQPPELLTNLVSPDAIRNLHLALAVSPTQVPFLHEFLPPERVHTLLHGVDTGFFQPGIRSEPGPVFRCVTTGHWLRDWPALRAVTKLLASRADIEFHVVTSRDTGLDGLPNVVIHREIDDNALLRVYQQAHVLVLPLTGTTANNSLLEGMACGLPLIVTDLPAVLAYVDERSARLIVGNDPEAIAQEILCLCDNPALRVAMSGAARARAESLAWSRVAADLADIYRAVERGRPISSNANS